MRRLCVLLALSACVDAFVGTMLVQGHADTIRTLRDIVRRSSLSRQPSTTPEVLSTSSENIVDVGEKKKVTTRARRHIGNVVVESGQCDHVDLVDCSDFETDEMTCMLTATGMTCCVCTGLLREAKRSLF